MKILFETIIAIGLSFLFIILIRKRKTKLKNIESIVFEKFSKNGWTLKLSSSQNGARYVLFVRGSKAAMAVFVQNFNFEVFKRTVILALLNRAGHIEVYHSTITHHVRKAVNFFNKNRRLHKMKMIAVQKGIT